MKYDQQKQLEDQFEMALAGLNIDLAVKTIEAMKDDDEIAHHMEKRLWEAVLKATDSDMAREALKSRDIEFSRWFA